MGRMKFAYQQEPIKVKVGELVRIYLSNLTEFDLLNSFHLQANFFHYYVEREILEITFPSG